MAFQRDRYYGRRSRGRNSEPFQFQGSREWLKEGEAKAEDIKRAMDNAEFCKPPEQAGPRDKQTTNETPFPDVIWPTTSTNSTGSYKEHKAIFPPDSIFEDYMAYSPTFANGGGLESWLNGGELQPKDVGARSPRGPSPQVDCQAPSSSDNEAFFASFAHHGPQFLDWKIIRLPA
jgi:hypothetical protein